MSQESERRLPCPSMTEGVDWQSHAPRRNPFVSHGPAHHHPLALYQNHSFLKNVTCFIRVPLFSPSQKTVPARSKLFQTIRRRSAGLAGHCPADVCHTFRRQYPAHLHGFCTGSPNRAPFQSTGPWADIISNLKIAPPPVRPRLTDFSFVTFVFRVLVLCSGF